MRKHAGSPPQRPQQSFDELPVGSCYVAVGGYGWVEIVARHDRASTGQRVAIVLPYHRAEHAAECLLQAPDCLVIRNGGGTIAEIPVQTILDRRSFAGFHVLDTNRADAAPGTDEGMRAFEQFLAGVSARTLNAQERRARDADPRG